MEENNVQNIKSNNEIKCSNCGAILTFEPGANSLKCPYCGTINEIKIDEQKKKEALREIDFYEFINNNYTETDIKEEKKVIRCPTCGAQVTFEANVVSGECPYCATPLILKDAINEKIIKPQALIPFKIDKNTAIKNFKEWLGKKWLAPGDLKKYGKISEKLQGLYVPYWTFDASSFTEYVGERGDEYQVEIDDTDADGKPIKRTETRVRWTKVRGTIHMNFNDILVKALKNLPVEVAGWNLSELQPFDERFLAGMKTQTYNVDVKEGFEDAKSTMDFRIENEIKRRIGGDRQRILHKNTDYSNITFKHILLPIWASAYKFKGKTYNFVVNGQNGKVKGQYPVSWTKIIIIILIVAAIIALILMFSN